eukprot:CAMPEP_0118641506 /NCGR_PEP_ID=MMETSP0785-20121206/5320_1 /TAXON_ID=91992 /ORGANISM="Bolidomonas pacifica, Strain CCMP 1866" /LENGTH=97 /DNA_ID=CAMNT_0006532959 /DNA_START=167 /DNA_END=457 /DNA_ORIENTATION=+
MKSTKSTPHLMSLPENTPLIQQHEGRDGQRGRGIMKSTSISITNTLEEGITQGFNVDMLATRGLYETIPMYATFGLSTRVRSVSNSIRHEAIKVASN